MEILFSLHIKKTSAIPGIGKVLPLSHFQHFYLRIILITTQGNFI